MGDGVPYASQWPEWVCRNSCGKGPFAPDVSFHKCPGCHGPLIRYMRYQQKKKGVQYAAAIPAQATRAEQLREHETAKMPRTAKTRDLQGGSGA